MDTAILDGVRVVDLTEGLAGPMAARLLAEAGAEVVKVERPGGDPLRATAAFASWNRSKQSQVLDLADPTQREALEGLLAGADVLIHGFGPARAKRWNLDETGLASRHPQLIVASVTGYPIDHPDADRPPHDILVQARTGLMDEQLGWRGGPIYIRFPLGQWSAAYTAAAGVVIRLLLRERSGRAGVVHTSTLQGFLTTLPIIWRRVERVAEGYFDPHPKVTPSVAQLMFECADGEWIQLMPGASEVPPVLEAVAEAGWTYAELDALPPAERYAAWQSIFGRRPSDAWIEAIRTWGAPVEKLRRFGDLLADPSLRGDDVVVEVDDPTWGPTLQAAAPFHTEPPSQVRSPAPVLDDHQVWHRARPSAPPTVDPGSYPTTNPLAGLRVLDFGMFIAGPVAPMLLADLGAEVIKVEPTTGDRFRQSGVLWLGVQRGKRSLAVDLARPEGQDILRRLVQSADVVHLNLRPQAIAKLGLGYDALRAINPNLVYCHVSAYGDGPRADDPGYDPTTQALAGWEHLSGGPGNPPMYTRFGMMDQQAGLASLVATCLALYRRQRTGQGSSVGSSLVSAAVTTQSETAVRLSDGSLLPVPEIDAGQTGLDPGYRLYAVSDGWLAVAALTSERRAALCRVAGVAVLDEVENAMLGRDTREVLDALALEDVPAEEARLDQRDAFFDSEVNRRLGLVASYEQLDHGATVQPGGVWSFGDLSLRLDRPPPATGEHSIEILDEIGLSADDVRRLADNGVVTGPALLSSEAVQ